MSATSQSKESRSWPSSKRSNVSHSAREAARTSTACIACRERKIKCSGGQPCRYCFRRKMPCLIQESSKRKLYPVAYVESLEQKLGLQEPFVSSGPGSEAPLSFHEGAPELQQPIRKLTAAASSMTAENASLEVGTLGDSAGAGQEAAVPTPISPFETQNSMSSSLVFGSHIMAMANDPQAEGNRHDVRATKPPDNSYGMTLPRTPQSMASFLQIWPTEEEGELLLHTVLASIGSLQHLFDPRAVADHLAPDFSDRQSHDDPTNLWHIELLLVFAVGELLLGRLGSDVSFPGELYFQQAMNNMPLIGHLNASGIQGVEIMGLLTFYLQCADRKDDAYIYAGIALRMALLLGLHRDNGTVSRTRSEKAHCTRLWWTIYMQERRLAAATGNPLSIADTAIRAAYPNDAPGFQSAELLNVNIKIARVTGKALQTIYANKEQAEQTFVAEVQAILSELHQISRCIPNNFALNFSNKLEVTRNSATLYLMLYQAMTLVTRPVLLHFARERVKGQVQPILKSKTLESFTETCIDAARHTLNILCALQRQNLIARFGFFDLDGTFSAAFVFVLAEAIHPSPHKLSGLSGIQSCLDIMAHLESHGNKPSAARQHDILQMCNQLSISRGQTATDSNTSVSKPGGNSALLQSNRNPPQDIQNMELDLDLSEIVLEQPLHWIEAMSPNDILSGQDSHELYAFYHNDNLALNGVIEADWEALEKDIFRQM